MSLKKWIIKEPDSLLANSLAKECDLPPFLARLAINRDITEAYMLDMFLADELELDDPMLLLDMDRAVDRISLALEQGEKIVIYGDYDCDGVTATALLYSHLSRLGGDVGYYIPDRLTEGYGMNQQAVRDICSKGASLIITVDNGINSIEEIELAKSLGVDVIVTDHHLPQGELPKAAAVVDPHRECDISDCRYLSGVGVALKLILALSPEVLYGAELSEYAQLVALGTIGDIVPIRDENRMICKYGLAAMNQEPLEGIKALRMVSKTIQKDLSVGSVSFSIVPRINAAGRIGSASRAVELLLENDPELALQKAEALDAENNERQQLCEKTSRAAQDIIDSRELYKNRVICVYGSGWHSGVIGIVASKIVEKYGAPAIVFSEADGVMHGSGRSIEGFNLFDAITYAQAAAVTFGGHELAAGVTVKLEDFEEFDRLINEYADDIPLVTPTFEIDFAIAPEEINEECIECINALEPFGAGNPKPVFVLKDAKLGAPISLKEGRFVRFEASVGDYAFNCISFDYSFNGFPMEANDRADIAFYPDESVFRGKKQITLFVKQIRPSKMRQDEYFASDIAYKELISNKEDPSSARALLPDREEFIKVFSYLKKSKKLQTKESLCFKFHWLGAGKVSVIIDALCSLGLIKPISRDMLYNGYVLAPYSGKVSLEDAEIMKKLRSCIEKEGAFDE